MQPGLKPSVHARWPDPEEAIARPALGRGRGGIGRHARFRFWWRKPWGFKSLRPHQLPDFHVLADESLRIKDFPANAGY